VEAGATVAANGLAARAEALLAAHHADRPLVLPNAWDAASAKSVEAAGYFVATSSNAIAAVIGERDDDSSQPDVIFDWVGRIARSVSVPVTADLQAGYRLAAADLVARLLDAGAVGCNLEDTDHHVGNSGGSPLLDADRQAEYLRAIRAAADARGVHVVINARVDAFVRKVGDEAAQLAEALRRGRLYFEAGADAVYPIMAADPEAVRRLAAELPGPINVNARRGGLTVQELTDLGVRRISFAAGLHQLTLAQLGEDLARIRGGASLSELWPAS
jgi:2-methylisocitrate lyase-like PEP mutase family enzyme